MGDATAHFEFKGSLCRAAFRGHQIGLSTAGHNQIRDVAKNPWG